MRPKLANTYIRTVLRTNIPIKTVLVLTATNTSLPGEMHGKHRLENLRLSDFPAMFPTRLLILKQFAEK